MGKLMHNDTTPIGGMWPIIWHNFSSEGIFGIYFTTVSQRKGQ